jgi:shikimate dehydrogenase
MKKFGLLGYPLGHSVSDYIHRRIFELCGLTDYEYKFYEINPGELSLKGSCLRELHGFNVTIPYKTEIIPYLSRLDKSAVSYGSVNTVNCVDYDYMGYNTDGYGFLKSIELLGASLSSKVLLLGCGGTGRMMAIEAIKSGAELTLAIRRDSPDSEKKAAKLANDLSSEKSKIKIIYTDNLNVTNSYDLLLNATPSGMNPDIDGIPITPAILSKVNYIFDAVYNPYPTKLIVEGEKRGVKAIGGLHMLVHQAVMAERIWNDIQLSDNEVNQLIKEVRALLI